MITAADIATYIDQIAPFETALSFDNCGLLVGNPDATVNKVLVCLDVTQEIVELACRSRANLIISHHPVIFHALKQVRGDSIVAALLKNGIAVISAHTNLDFAEHGVNYQLAKVCGLNMETVRRFPEEAAQQSEGFGLCGCLPEPMRPDEYIRFLKQVLGAQSIKYTDGKKTVKTVVISCGAGCFLLEEVLKTDAEAFVTAEAKHHELIRAKEAGLTLIDAGHYETEQVILEPLTKRLSEKFPEISFETAGKNPALYL